jgi:hypothetical protein
MPGLALLQMFVDQWGATVEEYDVDAGTGVVSVDVGVDRRSLRLMRIDRNEVIFRRNQALSIEVGAHVDVVRRFLAELRSASAA